MRKRLGEPADLVRGQAEGQAGVADRPPHPVGLRHRQGAHPLGAEPVHDPAVDLQAAGGLHVDVDVRQGAAAQVDEPLHQQLVVERVGEGDAEQVHDQGARAGTARLHPDAHLPNVIDDAGDRERIRGPAERVEYLQLRFQAGAHRGGTVVAVADHRRLAPLAQHTSRPAGGHVDDVLLGEVHPPDPQVRVRIEAALGSGTGGGSQQVRRPAPLLAGRADHFLGKVGHLGGVLQGPLPVADPAWLEGGEQPGRIQDVGDRSPVAGRVAHGIGEHRRQVQLGGKTHGARCQPQRPRPGTGASVVHGFQSQVLPEDVTPRRQQLCRPVRAAVGQHPHRFGRRTQQYSQAFTVLLDRAPGHLSLIHVYKRQARTGSPSPARPGPAT